jgi:hypothetical protein
MVNSPPENNGMATTEKWHVIDWTGKEMYDGKRFKSFEAARAHIREQAVEMYKYEKYTDAEEKRVEELREQYEEEMYAEEVEE